MDCEAQREKLIAEIVDREWEMFSQVQNVGGRADCQHDPETFAIMRRSQMQTWDLELLQSYKDDLALAKLSGRNLMTEKYAWMMRTTHPDEYEAIKESLPPVSEEMLRTIDEIVAIHLAWRKEVARKYPCLMGHGRPAEETQGTVTSLETYLRGELMTYSAKTLALYQARTLAKQKAGENEAQANLFNQVRQYGFDSLEACEAHLAAKAKAQR